MSYYYGEQYLQGKRLKTVIRRTVKLLRDKNIKFDTIAVKGNSGMLIGPSLAMEMNKSLLIIRKPAERNHSYNKVEGWGHNQRILILDDFIASGKTIESMIKSINDYCATPTIVAITLYACYKPGTTYKETYEYPVYTVKRIK